MIHRRAASRLGVAVVTLGAVLALASCAPPPPPPGPVGPPIPTCYDAPEFDFSYTGPVNTVGNLTLSDSTDGTCSGPAVAEATTVVAVDLSAAGAICAGLIPGTGGATLLQPFLVPNPGPNFFLCNDTPPPPDPEGPPIGTCFTPVNPSDPREYLYTGPENTVGNVTVRSRNTFCTGDFVENITAVVALNLGDAYTVCEGLLDDLNVSVYSLEGELSPDPGPNFWDCRLAEVP